MEISCGANGRIKALGSGGSVIDTQTSPQGISPSLSGSLDGKPWTWSFSHGSADIYEIRVEYSGTKTSGIGLAFDNFSPSEAAPVIPEPASVLLLGLGLGGLAIVIRRRRK